MKVVILAGWSAVGKKTTLRRILAGDPALRRRFGVTGRVFAVGISFSPLNRERCREADTILVQWQIREHDTIRVLRGWFPEAEFRCYLLLRDWEAHRRAYEARGTPTTVAELRRRTAWVRREFFGDCKVEIVKMEETL